MRDSQRQKVYNWAHGIPNEDLTWDECLALMAKVREDYGKRMVAVKDGRGTRVARGWANTINLPRWARTRRTVLHELAHTLVPYADPSHGPEYVRVFIDLLAKYGKTGMTAGQLATSARAMRIKVARNSAKIPTPLDRTEKRLRKEIAELRAQIEKKETELRVYLLK